MKRILIPLLALLLAACSPSANPTEPPAQAQVQAPAAAQPGTATPTALAVSAATSTPEPTPTAAPTEPSLKGVCDSPYYPIVDGAVWQYQTIGVGSSTSALSVEDDKTFTILAAGESSTFTIEGLCTAAGIVIMDSGMTTTTESTSGSGEITTTVRDGVTLPYDLQVGDEWSQWIELNTGTELSASTVSHYKALGFEPVTVPAGTFNALKVEQISTITMSGFDFEILSYLWYAEGVGNVKAEHDANGDVPLVTELVEFEIP